MRYNLHIEFKSKEFIHSLQYFLTKRTFCILLNYHFKNICCIIFIREVEKAINSPLSVFRMTEKRYNSEHERKVRKELIILTLTTTIFESMIGKMELAVTNAIIFSSLIYLLTDIH